MVVKQSSKSGTEEVICQSCGKTFEYNKEFFEARNFVRPKRCPTCAAKVRGREIPGEKTVVIDLPAVRIDIPEDKFKAGKALKRKDSETQEQYVSCVRYRLYNAGTTTTFINVYDQRVKEKSDLNGQVVALRVMRKKETKQGGIIYTYLVFDHAEEEPKYKLILGDDEDKLWKEGDLTVARI